MSYRMLVCTAVAVGLTAAGTGASYVTSVVTAHAEESRQPEGSHSRMPIETLRAYHRPTGRYIDDSCVIDLSTYDELSLHAKVRGCGTTVRFSTEFMRMSVPRTWGPWSCPPRSESCTPDVMYSNHAVAATIDFGTTVTTGGFEYSPARFQVERVRVAFFSGPQGSGALVGSITRDVDGDGGARLFGGSSETGFRSAVVTNDSDDDFAIAQIRV
jgi:hypothetical protein